MTPAVLLIGTLLVGAAGDPPVVHYVTKVMTKSWEPIDLPQVEKVVESAVLEELTKPGSMRLERSSFADLAQGEYSLKINGRFVEEAERFSVYVTFGPGKSAQLPSFHVTDTSDALGRQKRAVMEQRIRDAARRAGRRMAEVLAPRLESARLNVDPPPLVRPDLPFAWGDIEIPDIPNKSKAIKVLLDVKNPDHERANALREIQGHVFDQQAARNAVEHCVLRDPSPQLRTSCARALAPKARDHAPTQRILLHALRTDVDDNVVGELTKITADFVGLSRFETIATWLELVTSPGASRAAARNVAQLLRKEDDLPNLDFAVASCLQMDTFIVMKKEDCAEALLPKVPPERRRAVVWSYLKNIRAYSSTEQRLFDDLVRILFGRKVERDPVLAAAMLDIAERPSAGWVRSKALYVAGENLESTPAILERVARLVYEPELNSAALRAMTELASDHPDQIPMAIGALRRIRDKAKFLPAPARANPYEEIDETIERLERALKRANK